MFVEIRNDLVVANLVRSLASERILKIYQYSRSYQHE